MAHVAPTLFIVALFSSLGEGPAPANLSVAFAAGGWAFCLGLRWILLHQIWDWPYDVKAGVPTFAVRAGTERARRWVERVAFPGEMLALAALAVLVSRAAPLLIWLLGLGLALDFARPVALYLPFALAPASPRPTPPFDLYRLWLPLSLVALLALSNLAYLPIVVVHIGLFYTAIRDCQMLTVLSILGRRLYAVARHQLRRWLVLAVERSKR
jgi:hypothetical protein